MKRVLFFTLAFLAFASCNKDMLDTESQPITPGSQGRNTIRATIGDQTKTTVVYGNPNLTAGETSLWSEDDTLCVTFLDLDGVYLKEVMYVIKPGDGGKATAEFTTDEELPAEGNYIVKAGYPGYGYYIPSYTLQIQHGANANHIGKYDAMVAGPVSVHVDSDGNADINLAFQHCLPMLRFRLKNTTANSINITSIKIRSENPANQFYRFASADYTGVSSSQLVSEMGLTCENTTVAAGGATISDFYMMLAGNTVSDTNAGLIIAVHFGTGQVQEFVIPTCDFLKTPFVGGMRYYFNLTVTGANITERVVDGIKYELNTTAGTARLVDGTGASGNVTVPAAVDGCNVISIGHGAFSKASIEGLTFAPGSHLATIESHAFYGCTNLTGTITIPASVTSIRGSAFNGAGITGIAFAPGSQLATIGEWAFSYCYDLTGIITIPASVTSIDEYAFYGTGITGLTFETTNSQLVTIGNYAFSDCVNLTGTITIPASVTSIRNGAFYRADITGLTFETGSKLQTIEDWAFFGCSSLTVAITIPALVTSIGDGAFNEAAITGITFEAGSHLATIGEFAFKFCSDLIGITIPASVTSIGDEAFSYSGLLGITFEIGSQLTTIGIEAFLECSGLTGTITIPASVTSIGNAAFEGADITAINMTCTTPPTLGAGIFHGYTTLTIYVPSSAATNYNTVINGKLNGWNHSSMGAIDLSMGTPISLANLGGATSVTIMTNP